MTDEVDDTAITHLLDAPAVRGELARWYEAEWTPFYGPDGPGDAGTDLDAAGDRDRLPICLVALDGGGRLAGSISLRARPVVSNLELTPWVAAPLVRPGRSDLIARMGAAVAAEARRLGYQRLYVETDPDDALLAGQAWERIETATTLRGVVGVYELVL